MLSTGSQSARTVLVTDGGERAALAVVRSLGKAGHRVHVTAARVPSLAGASRLCAGESGVPDALGDPEAFAARVREIAEEVGASVLLPITDASLLAVLERPEAFVGITVPFPDLAAFGSVSDKAEMTRLATQVGMAAPRTFHLERPSQIEAAELRELPFPVVIKPSRSVFESTGRREKVGVAYAQHHAELVEQLASLPEDAFPILLQERIRGDGMGVFLLLWNDRVLARFAHRRIREKPPSGGVSVLRESSSCSAELFDQSAELLRRCGWRGVAMIEYKLSRDSGIPYLMEVNGRFWGSLQLAIDAGVDFPRILVDAATGSSVEPTLSYRPGVRSRWLMGDFDHLLTRMRHSRSDLALGSDAPGRPRVLWDFARAFVDSSRSEVFRWSDPRPALREARRWLRDVLP